MSNTGFELVVDADLLKELDSVDDKLQQIAATAMSTQKSFNEQMSAMANGSITDLITKLQTANTTLGNLTGFEKAAESSTILSQGLQSTGDVATVFVTQLSSISDSLNKLYESQNNRGTASLIDIDTTLAEVGELGDDLDGLRQQIVALKRMRSENQNFLFDDTQRKNAKALTTEIRSLQTQVDKLTVSEKAIKKFDSAMALGESTIAQRTNKITRLTQAQEILNKSNTDYSTQVAKAKAEILRLSAANDTALKSTEKLKTSQSKMLDITGQLARQAALVFSVSQLKGYYTKLVQVRGEFELQQKSLQAIMQDKYQADKVWSQIVDLSVRSPFRLSELTTYTKQLAAYRIENEKIFETTTMLADISAGLGVDMQRLILAYGQVKAANYLRGQELRQFSEAGINILGELSDYFSELEGRAISTADVFEMVSKRMVTFGDVEVVFERLTEAGGIFYNMQEIQAETLVGKMSNLGDAIDIMLNKIGQSNEDALKGGIDAVRYLVENYETLLTVLKSLAWGFVAYTAQCILAAKANAYFAKTGINITVALKTMPSLLTKIGTAFKSLTAAMANNPITIAAIAISAAIGLIVNRFKSMEEASEFYDTLTNQVQDNQKAFEKSATSIEKNNKAIEEFNNAQNNLTKGTEEYAEAEEKANKARNEQDILLEKLKKDHPTIASNLKVQENGVVDLTTAQENFNEQLRQTRILNYLASDSGGFFSDDLKTNINDYAETISETRTASQRVESSLSVAVASLKQMIDSNTDFADAYSEEINQIVNSTSSDITKVIKLNDLFTNGLYSQGKMAKWNSYILGDLAKSGYKALFKATDEANKALSTSKDSYAAQKTLITQLTPIIDKYAMSIDTTGDDAVKNANVAIKTFVDALGIQEQALVDLVKKQFEIRLGVKLDFEDAAIPAELTYIQERINEYLASNPISAVSDVSRAVVNIESSDVLDEYFGTVAGIRKDLEAESTRLATATEQLFDGISNVAKKAEVDAAINKIDDFTKTFGRFNSTVKPNNDAETAIKNQITLLSTLNSKFEDLRGNYNQFEAFGAALQSYSQSIKDIGDLDFLGGNFTQDMLDQITAMDFAELSDADRIALKDIFDTAGFGLDDMGIYELLQKMQDEAKKAGTKSYDAWLKAWGSKGVELAITAKVKGVEEVQRNLDNLFEGYDLTIQMQALGFTDEQMKELFNFDAVSVADLKTKVEDEIKGMDGVVLTDSGLIDLTASSQEVIDEYNSRNAEIAKIEIDAQKARNKRVAEYLRVSLTEREQLEKDFESKKSDIQAEADAMRLKATKAATQAEADALISAANTMEEKGIGNVTAKYNLDVAEQDFKDFKLTSEYTKAFEDLDNFGSATIDHLLAEFEKFAKTPNLSPEAVKTLNDKMRELYETSIMRNPFSAFTQGLKEYSEATKVAKAAQQELIDVQSKYDMTALETEATETAQVETEAAATLEGTDISDVAAYEAALNAYWIAAENAGIASFNLAIAQGEVDAASKKSREAIDEQLAALNKTKQAVSATEDQFGNMNSMVSGAISLFEELAEGLGITLSDETSAVLDSINKGFSVMASIFPMITLGLEMQTAATIAADAATKSLMTTMLPLLAASVALAAIFAVFSLADSKRDAIIESETREVELLQNAYEDLETTFDQAYTIDELESTSQEMLDNIDDQIAALEKARAAEMDKKNSDQDAIDDYNEQIADKYEQALEQQYELTRELGGIGADEYKSAAQDFVNAWLDAFEETGDGLSGLEEEFDDMVKNMILATAVSKAMDAFMAPLFTMIDEAVEGGVTQEELDEIMAEAAEIMPELSAFLEELYTGLGVTSDSDTSDLTGLQTGLESLTEDTGSEIIAYMNTIRFELYRQGEVFNSMLIAMEAVASINNTENSIIYKALLEQTAWLKTINNNLESVIKASPSGGMMLDCGL